MHKFKLMISATLLSLAATGVQAENWTLEPSLSNLTFASIKNDYTGENHTFTNLSGMVSDDGEVMLSIDLGSLETMIDIRNERMIEHVFNAVPDASVTASIDVAELDELAVGEATTLDTFGMLSLLGTELPLDASLFVMRLSESRVLVTTNGMVMMSTEDAGINAGIDVLQELAGLDSITRVSPVTLRLVFDQAM